MIFHLDFSFIINFIIYLFRQNRILLLTTAYLSVFHLIYASLLEDITINSGSQTLLYIDYVYMCTNNAIISNNQS